MPRNDRIVLSSRAQRSFMSSRAERGDLGCLRLANNKREIASQAILSSRAERGDLGCQALKEQSEIASYLAMTG